MPMSDYYHHVRERIGDMVLCVYSVNAIIVNNHDEVLLQRRKDDGQWVNPGGAIEPGELPVVALVREIKEETGLDVYPVRVTGVYGGPDYVHTYPNGDTVAILSISFLCEVIGGKLGGDPEETAEVRFFHPDELPEMHPRFVQRIRHALDVNVTETHYQTE